MLRLHAGTETMRQNQCVLTATGPAISNNLRARIGRGSDQREINALWQISHLGVAVIAEDFAVFGVNGVASSRVGMSAKALPHCAPQAAFTLRRCDYGNRFGFEESAEFVLGHGPL